MHNKTIIAAIFATFVGAALPMSSFADDAALGDSVGQVTLVESGTLELEATQIRLILGGSKGAGVLHFQGKDYKFKMSGGSAGGVGVTKVDAVGTVYNLNDISEFPGTYTGGTAGVVVAKGVGASSWQNSKGVVVKVKAKSSEGLALNLGLAAVNIELVQE